MPWTRTGLLLGKLNVSLFVDNLLNSSPRLYTTHQVFSDPTTGAPVGSPLYTSFTERPLTAGLTAVFRF